MTKPERHFAIKEIIGSLAIGSQEELRRQLDRRGCRVTQATLSRDLKDLGVAWVASPEGGHYALQPAGEVHALRPLVGAEIVGFRRNETLIVIQTLPGAASTVAEFIDVAKDPDIIGTIAGDNTVLIVPRTVRRLAQIAHRLKQTLIEGREP
jgi:transcriptional regulator of arginine metabolism